MQPVALVRRPTADFRDCVTDRPADPPLDPAIAAAQHAAYCQALGAGGFVVWEVPPAPGFADAPFIEDTAVIVGDRALVTRPGHRSRRAEVAGVAAVLAGLVDVTSVAAPGTIDGGDVLQVGDRILVGRSARTDSAGIAALSSFVDGREVVAIDVTGVLHLKSAVTALDDETLLVFPGVVDVEPLAGYRLVTVPGTDPEVANTVRLPDGRILVGSLQGGSLVSDLGFEPVIVDVSEFGRAGGGLTCLSLRLRDVFAAETP